MIKFCVVTPVSSHFITFKLTYKSVLTLLSSLSAVTCSSLGTFANGQIIYSTDTTAPYDYGTVATFTCNTEFSLSGDSTRTCRGDGSSQIGVWSGSSPVCVGELLCVGICC